MTGLVKGIIFTAAMGGSEAPLPEVAPPYLLSPPTVEAVCSSTPLASVAVSKRPVNPIKAMRCFRAMRSAVLVCQRKGWNSKKCRTALARAATKCLGVFPGLGTLATFIDCAITANGSLQEFITCLIGLDDIGGEEDEERRT